MSTPLEINKKIGKLRYDYARSIEVNGKLIGNDVVCQNECWITELRLADSKNWAEKIADAWELFEEMGGQIITEDRYSGAYSGGKWLCTYETLCPEEVLFSGPQSDDTDARLFWDEPVFCVAAETAPLAICKAWLAWKENEK